MPSQHKRASLQTARSAARSEHNRTSGGRAERSTRSERAGVRSFHRVRTLEGTRVTTSTSAGSSTTDLASLSSNGSLSTSGSRTNLSHASHRARPRRTKSLKMTLNSTGANNSMMEAVRKEQQKRSLSKPRACSTRQTSTSLHEMELLQSTIDCSSNSHNTTANITTGSSDASSKSRLDRVQNNTSSKLNAAWESNNDSSALAAPNSPRSPLTRTGTNNSIGVPGHPRSKAGSSSKLGLDDLDSSDDDNNEQSDLLPQVLMAPSLSLHLSNGGASKRISALSATSSARMLDDSNYSNTSYISRPSTTSATRNFSTASVHMARQFLQETDDEPNTPLETFKDEYSSASFRRNNSSSHTIGEHHSPSLHSSKHNNSSHRGINLTGDEEMGDYSFAHDASGLLASDLEWNPEIQRQQHDEWRKLRLAEEAAHEAATLGHSHNQFPDRPDLRHVDQTINLMDVSGGDVNDDKESEPPPARKKKDFISSMNASMVDVWLDTTASPTDNSLSDSAYNLNGRRQQKKNRKRNKKQRKSRPSQYYLDRDDESWLGSCCREVFCSRYTVVLILAGLLAVLVGLKTKGVWGTSAPPVAAANTTITTTPPTAAPTTPIPSSETETNDEPADDTNTDSTDEGEFEAASGRLTRPPIIAAEFEKHKGEEKVLDKLKKLLEQFNLADSPALSQESPPSPQYLALHWVAHLGADPDGVLGASNHKLVHPEDGEEEDADATDMMSNEDCIRLVAYALATLYYSTNGPDTTYALDEHPASKGVWRKADNWMQPTPICEWHGVICEENSLTDSTVVSHLNLTRNQLKGTIPSEVFQILFSLKSMDLTWNELTGTLPSEVELNLEEGLTTKPSLEVLWLGHNKLEGTFPTSWGKLASLENLQFEHNHIYGSLPPQINQLTNLRWLSLHQNRFSGKFPYIEDMQSLEYLFFYGNTFAGKLPYELFRIPSMVEIRGQDNLFSGTIPPELQNLRQLQMLRLEGNAIEGEVPDIFDHLTNLREIYLQSNKLEGPIPTTIGTLSLLDWLSLDSNAFTGTIPTELSNLKLLREFKCYGNHLSGPLPAGLCMLKDTYELKLLAVDCDKISDCSCCNGCP